ncbi:hypothetical protein [Candidatus Hecatella orcuttiae]|uniref:hypothetical protein n=1 Tax=Candidatus Hecatella orcuttiae TaxID=1935119 RepID=UPI002867E610|nr:hypothetical protein [Candidatus Hecatella orcuttiae]
MAGYSTIKVDDETYAQLLSCRLKAQSKLGRDLSLNEAIRLLTELAPKPSGVSDKEFEEALARFCPGMRDVEVKEAAELRKALGGLDA